ncbi:MAG: DUF2806 domain-containing protein [Gammaproteobacteria bacterium]|nr:DUF2806 domain-containing protein [Gammaproteobacteria bacterium]
MTKHSKVSALGKLFDHVASGVGSIAGPMLATWRAKKEVEANLVKAEGDSAVLDIRVNAQAKASKSLNSEIPGNLDISHKIQKRTQYQEQKRQQNIESIVMQAADYLGDQIVKNHDTDHDWTARFFSEVQDVSNEKMQVLWAKVLAGEVKQTGLTSAKTLGVIKNLNQEIAMHFSNLCSACVYIRDDEKTIDARVPTLGDDPGSNCLQQYGLNFHVLNILNEHGLIISDYNSWRDYRYAIGVFNNKAQVIRLPFEFQNRNWVLIHDDENELNKEFRLLGVAMTESGKELSQFVEIEPMVEYSQDLKRFFLTNKLKMTEVD